MTDRPSFRCLRCGFSLDLGPLATFESTVKLADMHRCPTPAPPRWEYLVLETPHDEKLNEAGALGWELVAMMPHNLGRHGGYWGYFKRPIVEG